MIVYTAVFNFCHISLKTDDLHILCFEDLRNNFDFHSGHVSYLSRTFLLMVLQKFL